MASRSEGAGSPRGFSRIPSHGTLPSPRKKTADQNIQKAAQVALSGSSSPRSPKPLRNKTATQPSSRQRSLSAHGKSRRLVVRRPGQQPTASHPPKDPQQEEKQPHSPPGATRPATPKNPKSHLRANSLSRTSRLEQRSTASEKKKPPKRVKSPPRQTFQPAPLRNTQKDPRNAPVGRTSSNSRLKDLSSNRKRSPSLDSKEEKTTRPPPSWEKFCQHAGAHFAHQVQLFGAILAADEDVQALSEKEKILSAQTQNLSIRTHKKDYLFRIGIDANINFLKKRVRLDFLQKNMPPNCLEDYVFFQKFAESKNITDFRKEDVEKLSVQFNLEEIYAFYKAELINFDIVSGKDLEQIDLFFNSKPHINECEALLQAAQKSRPRYVFFRKFAESKNIADLPKELRKEDVEKLKAQFDPEEIYTFYKAELAKCGIEEKGDLEKIGLFIDNENPEISECEATLQAAHNLWQMIVRIYDTFHKDFPGSSDKIDYFFTLIENQEWLKAVTELDLEGLDLTWVSQFLSSQSFINLKMVNLPHNDLSEIPYEFFSNCPQVTIFCASDNPSLWAVAPDFGHNRAFEELYFCRTKIKTLPRSVTRSKTLLKIDASDSELSHLSSSFGKFLSAIATILFAGTKLPFFPFPNFERKTKQFTLNLRGTLIPKELFPKNPNYKLLTDY